MFGSKWWLADPFVKHRIHYHSDCPFFAGCENMLVNFWSSQQVRASFDISFSYRDSSLYSEGLRRRARIDFPAEALRFPEPSDVLSVSEKWPRMLRRILRFGSRLAFTVPLLLYEIWVLHRLFRRVSPDVVHINNGGYPAALSARAAAIAARLTSVPSVVMVVNNLAINYREPLRWLEYPLDRAVARSVTQFVTGSQAAAGRLKATLGLPGHQCVPINNGIKRRQTSETVTQTRDRLGLRGFEGVVFGIVAVMEPRKGHRVLLEAMTKLRCVRQAKLVIEGDGPLRESLERYVADNGLAQYCIFTGVEANVMNLFAAIDVLILPSIDHEDFPNVILEAMSCGRAVIASRLAGTPEQVIDGVTGYLVAPTNSNELAAMMECFCADPTLQLRMGQSGLERFEKQFTAEVAVGKYVALYSSLIEARSK